VNARRLGISSDAAVQPLTFRVTRTAARDAACRRLAISILGLDVRTLTAQLRTARLANEDRAERPGSYLRRVA